ncbi:hypothetical protein [Roseimicrobium sp. ORNL1]|uniref:hypothetical protein n=1 Tax=Roseimicrobium sp. ORNL1 TaxID=2711231 RepID=UPI0013E1B3CF|nr:hypothetical protein [Roseimicrobium sp. ORNL1]QIF01666.1 hypothetical protein G5S37_09070 [Roseimicrobium sp. ORNL1]
MPLLDQLEKLSEPGNPQGVCALSAAITAHVLVHGPRSLEDITKLSLPLELGERQINPQRVRTGDEDDSPLDVSKLPSGDPDIWKWKKKNEGTEKQMAQRGGENLLKWLKNTAKPGVYAATMADPGDEDDTHHFNFAKTDDGKVYLLDSSIQNFKELKGPEDVGMLLIAQLKGNNGESEEEEEKVGEELNLDELELEEVTLDDLDVDEPLSPKVEKQTGEKSSKMEKEPENDKEESQEEELSMAPFSKVYCSSNMKLDYCGPLHPECALELQQSLKRSVRQDYNPSEKPGTGQKITVTHN